MGDFAEGAPRIPVRRWLPLAALAAAVVLFFALGLEHYLTFARLAENRAALEYQVARLGPAAVVSYVVLYAVLAALSVPGAAILTMAGGLLFGTVVGGTAALVGATVGATVLFTAARTSLGALLERRAQRRGSADRFKRLEAGFRAHEASYLLALRLVPLFPFWLVNLVAALLGMRLRTFVLCSLVGMAPGAFVYAGIGAGLGAVIARGGEPDLAALLAPRILLPLLGLAALTLLPVLARRRGLVP
ncbi:MAG TPA: TVP38/TMEM64 family protein [Stellaceae bacterium]|nr:TVP38/TMEM64 family protein [Stellaceae bacterium]